ncbi:GNAT family N-acetyltransferase [Ideonella sp. A 288]|uniref:GNAT family N-acetyltransferase n=1 Tax=Ideonella sp. A 288 TaxID=1962181 RepID=UPI000B4A863B|nr:GNAT family N-acetyltransferase [Ideonella sp. A 288]
MDLAWTWQRFAELGVDGVYDMLALRAKVFILEQGPYLDPDGLDRQAWHLLGRDGEGELRAYLRVVDPGAKYDEPSIGRVVVDKALRGSGAGHALVAEGVARCVQAWPGQGIRISAQAHLQGYCGRHGFVTVGDGYLEDDIPHVQMWRQP